MTLPVRFMVDGISVDAMPGASVAAALFNAGHLDVRRSVGGAPRGPLCGMGICFECRVTIDGVAHRRSCMETVRDGMRVETDA